MISLRKGLAALLGTSALAFTAHAQSGPGWDLGYVPSQYEIQYWWTSKVDTTNGKLTTPTVLGPLSLGIGGPQVLMGIGSPLGVVSAPVGSEYHRVDGAAGAALYVKEAGTDATGWVAYGAPGGGSGGGVSIGTTSGTARDAALAIAAETAAQTAASNAQTAAGSAATTAASAGTAAGAAQTTANNAASAVLGRLLFRGAWAASTVYSANDVVLNGGLLYVAPAGFTSSTSFNPANWTALTSAASAGVSIGTASGTAPDAALTNAALSAKMQYRGAWAASTAYAVNDVVLQGGLLYLATAAFTSGATFTASNWALLFPSSVQLTALVNLFTSSLAGAAPASGGGTANFLRADGTWAAPPSGGSSGPTVRSVSTGTTDTSTTTVSTVIKWVSTTAGAKAETIPACASGLAGVTITIKDGVGSAGGPGTAIAITPASGTIDGQPTLTIANAYGAKAVICDGTTTDWSVVYAF